MLFCTLYSQKTPKERQTVTALAGCSGKGYKSDLSIYEYYNKLRVCVCVCVWGGGGGGGWWPNGQCARLRSSSPRSSCSRAVVPFSTRVYERVPAN